ncbi:hypothetical protein WJX81_005000 [Elliptochloris bilobata]|uniref:SGNH hydrolase-type esterase domain-containing protein n=1 Tax=Elliptochloris bilobata TaxID=381761 RepID=A0AAW1R0S2_9CHLO
MPASGGRQCVRWSCEGERCFSGVTRSTTHKPDPYWEETLGKQRDGVPGFRTGFRDPAAAAALRLLLVGNSFVHRNEGAETVTAGLLGERLGAHVWAKRYAPGGHTWAKHLADALDAGNPLHALLGAGGTQQYDYVIFQEQSQAPALGATAVAESAAALGGLIRLAKARGAQSVLLQTWAYAAGDPDNRALFPDYPTMQRQLDAGYVALAASARERLNTPAFLAPVGRAWHAVFDGSHAQDAAAELPRGKATFRALYAEDGIHPSGAGTYLEACVIASAITGCKTEGLRYAPAALPPAWPPYLQRVADAAVFERSPPEYPPYPWSSSCPLRRRRCAEASMDSMASSGSKQRITAAAPSLQDTS